MDQKQNPHEVPVCATPQHMSLMLFKSNRCPHCVAFWPTFKNVRDRLVSEGEDPRHIIVAEGTEAKYRPLFEQMQISGVPTMILHKPPLRDGTPAKWLKYTGPRTESDLLRAFRAHAENPTSMHIPDIPTEEWVGSQDMSS